MTEPTHSPADRDTPLSKVSGIHRKTLLTAIGLLLVETDKTRKAEQKIGSSSVSTDEIEASAEHLKWCLGESKPDSGLAGTPIGDAMDAGAKKHERQIDMELADISVVDVEVSDEVLTALMVDKDITPQPTEMALWSKEDREAVYRYLVARGQVSDGKRTKIPRIPTDLLKPHWFSQAIQNAIRDGLLEAETLAPVELTQDEVKALLDAGPWRIVEQTEEKAGQEVGTGEFGIEWAETIEEGALPPTHPFVYERPKARLIAARLNRQTQKVRAAAREESKPENQPLPHVDEAKLAEQMDALQQVVHDDIFKSQPEHKLEKLTLAELKTWHRNGPYFMQEFEGDRFQIVRKNGDESQTAATTTHDAYDASVRVALLNFWEFNGDIPSGEPGKRPKRK